MLVYDSVRSHEIDQTVLQRNRKVEHSTVPDEQSDACPVLGFGTGQADGDDMFGGCDACSYLKGVIHRPSSGPHRAVSAVSTGTFLVASFPLAASQGVTSQGLQGGGASSPGAAQQAKSWIT